MPADNASRKQIIFGAIPGVLIGSAFPDRRALHDVGLHRPLQSGISGREHQGAESIVLSGGYEDDIDNENEIVYTGQGGNDPRTGRQNKNQELRLGNRALVRNQLEGLPVRVIRGANSGSKHAPRHGYRYDGLYYVEDHWSERGKSGFLIWRYRLRRFKEELPISIASSIKAGLQSSPARIQTIVFRIVRSTLKAIKVKILHDYRCQICSLCLETDAGPYAEAAHIRPLGTPHNGPDLEDNILCLCPNHHVLFDSGMFAIGDDFKLIGLPGLLNTIQSHHIKSEHINYHRKHHGFE